MNFRRRAEYRVELSETTDLAVAVTTQDGSPVASVELVTVVSEYLPPML